MAGQETYRRFSDDQLLQIMRSEGYDSVTLEDKGILRIKNDDVLYLLLNNDDGDIQAYYGVQGFTVSYTDMNEWNRDHRLSRAYIDSDGDPVLEADLLSNGGLTIRNVTEMFRVFLQSVDSYHSFLRKQDRS
jgi:hypothetical protein